MATETFVQLPSAAPDNSNKIRVLQITELENDGTVANVLQDVATLADDYGALLLEGGEGANALKVGSRAILERLDRINVGLAHLALLLIDTGRPRRGAHLAETWIAETLERI
jgi:hypothetical protein